LPLLVREIYELAEVCDLVQTGGGRKPTGRDGSVLSHRQQWLKERVGGLCPPLAGQQLMGFNSN
jgi:hypothetical protein